jgi:transcriptional regulator with XRE-family HTH domain
MYPNLKLKLWSTGMKQNRLALMLGMDETMLSKVINGFREATPDIRKRIANLLQADEAWLFQRESAELEYKSPERERD